MRIDRLDLLAFGPFTRQTLDFSAGTEGLHLILGPNEAGKSSALRALRQLLFGIKPQTSDDFLHPYPELRIGATLRHEGEALSIVRRKAKKSLYLGPDDELEMDEATLSSRFLGGITADAFERMFTLDHVNLSEGRKATLDTTGEFSQILFGASLDLPRLRKYQKSLEEEMDGLFLPRGRRKINLLLGDLETARNLVLAQSIKGNDWTEHTTLLNELRRMKEQVDREWSEIDRQRKRLERILRAGPDVALWKEIRRGLADLEDVPELSDDFSDRRGRFEETLREATIARDLAEIDRQRLAESLAGLPPRSPIHEASESIEALKLELGSERKAAENREKAARSRDDAMVLARGYLADLGRDDDPETAKVPAIAAHAKAQIRKLGTDRHALKHEREAAYAEIAASGRTVDALEAEIATLPRPRNADELARVIKRIEGSGDPSTLIESSAKDISRLRREVQTLVARLGEPGREAEGLAQLAVPSPDVIESFKTRWAELENEASVVLSEVHKCEDRRVELRGKIEQRRSEAVVPSEDELREARLAREARWRLIKATWRDGNPLPESDRPPLGGDLGESFEEATRLADEVSDRLKRDAARVAEEVRDLADLSREAARLSLAIGRRDDSTSRINALRSQWLEAWKASGLSPRSPQEMTGWVSDHGRLVEKVQALLEKTEQVASWRETSAQNVGEIHREIVALGEPVVASEPLAAARTRGHEILCLIRDEAASRREQVKARNQAEASKTAAQIRFEESDRALAAWDVSWGRAIEPLGLDAGATDEQVTQFVDSIEKFSLARELILKNREILREAENASSAFRARLTSLAARFAPALGDRESEAIVAGLVRTLQEANFVEQQREQLGKQHHEKDEAVHTLVARIAGVRQNLAALCREAGCESLDGLREVERRWASRRDLLATLHTVEERLRPLAQGKSLPDFAEEADAEDGDALPAKLQALESDHQEKDSERQALSTQIGEEQERLRGLETTARHARAESAAADCEHLMARLESEVDRYVHLRLAWALLRDAIEEFRKKNQAPVLQRAGALFAKLTLGSFADLRVDLNEKDETVLMGVRPDGQPSVDIKGMSVGTVDQLYLALKLALLDYYLQSHPALPLVLDDLLIQFDDERACAALATLADVSRRTQVLFFTHHEHLVELASRRLPPDVLFIHRLAGSRSLPGSRPAGAIGPNGK